jgi:hypothetical protein
MFIALILSCGLISLPVVASMIVVRHAGVNLSGPRYTPLDDNMLYVRWDEGHVGSMVAALRRRTQTWPAAADPFSADDARELVAVWDIDVAADD